MIFLIDIPKNINETLNGYENIKMVKVIENDPTIYTLISETVEIIRKNGYHLTKIIFVNNTFRESEDINLNYKFSDIEIPTKIIFKQINGHIATENIFVNYNFLNLNIIDSITNNKFPFYTFHRALWLKNPFFIFDIYKSIKILIINVLQIYTERK